MTAFLPSIADLEPNPTWAKLPLFDRTDCKRERVGAVVEICNKTWEIWDPEEAALVEVEKVFNQHIDRFAETIYDKLPKDDRVLDLRCGQEKGTTRSGNDFRIQLRRVSATFAQCLGKSPFRLRGPFPSSGQREQVHPKSEIVLRPRFA